MNFTGGFIVGVAVMTIISSLITTRPGSFASQAHEAIKNCERDLPRSEHCILTAIPESQK